MFNQEKKLNYKKNSKEYAHEFRLFGLIWLATIFIFLIFLDLLASEKVNFSSPDQFSSILLTVFLLDILIGTVVFSLTLIKGFQYLRSKPEEKHLYETNNPGKQVLFAVIVVLLVVVLGQATGIIEFAGFEDRVIQPTAVSTPLNKQIVDLINNERKKNNLPFLYESNLLIQSATDKIDDMLSKNYWSTNSPDGKTPFFFITKVGYKYDYAGESLIKNFYTAKDIVNALLADNINKDNILTKNFKDVGLAIKDGSINGQQSRLIVIHFGSIVSTPTTPQPQVQQRKENNARPTQQIDSPKPTNKVFPVLSGANIFYFINDYRLKNGVPQINQSEELCRFAQQRADFLVQEDPNLTKSSIGNHYKFSEFFESSYDGKLLGENIATNVSGDVAVVEGWKSSPPHNELMLSNKDSESGTLFLSGCVRTATRPGKYPDGGNNIAVFLLGDR